MRRRKANPPHGRQEADGYFSYVCDSCERKRVNAWYHSLDTKEKRKRGRRGYALLKADPAKYLFQQVRNRMNRTVRTAYPVLLTFEEFMVEIGGKMPKLCPILGIPIRIAKDFPDDNSATIDRIDNDRPYEVGNVAVISRRANFIKRNGTADEHRKIAAWMDGMAKRTAPR